MRNGDADGAEVVVRVRLVGRTLLDGDGDENENGTGIEIEIEIENENEGRSAGWEVLGYPNVKFFSDYFPDPVLSRLNETTAMNCTTLVSLRMLTRSFGLRGDFDSRSITKKTLMMLAREKTPPENRPLLVYMKCSSR